MIPIYTPYNAKNQKIYLKNCIRTNQIGQGKYIKLFEQALQDYLGVKHAITVSNGSVSLQLILYALGIGYGDEVIVPSLTYAATVSSINIMGAKAILTDSDNNLQIKLKDIETLITEKTKAIMVPQLYGDAPDMLRVVEVCKRHNIFLIEDSAEAFGCSVNGKNIGTYSIASSFSLFANKTITTFEGGFIATNNDGLAERLRLLRNQSHMGNFIHNGPGFNARLTNFQAAIGLAQLEEIERIIKKKKVVATHYREFLSPKIGRIMPKITSSEWMPCFILPEGVDYLSFAAELRKSNIDSRPIFTPIHLMSGFNIGRAEDLSNCEKIYGRVFNLPSFPNLRTQQLKYICDVVNSIVEGV